MAVPPSLMVICPALPIPLGDKAEMLQGEQSFVAFPSLLVVKVPVARKLLPAVMVISPFLPSVLIWVTSMSLLALRVTLPLLFSVDVASMDPV